MSKNIKVQLIKNNQKKLENLLNSYNTLKSILSPNLTDNNNLFMNSLIEIVISQLKLYLNLINLNETKKMYELLNLNNQNLSKKIAFLYELPKFSDKYSNKSILFRNENKKNSLDDVQQFFNTNYIDSVNFELTENQNEREILKDTFKSNENNENDDIKEMKINSIDEEKEKKYNEREKEKEKEKEKGKEREKEREKLIKKDREEREKLREKEKLIQNLKKQEKEKEKEIREKARRIIKQTKVKEKDNINKTQIKKNTNKVIKKAYRSPKKVPKNKDNCSPKTILADKEKELGSPQKEVKFPVMKIKERNTTPKREKNRFKYYLFDFDDEKNFNSSEEDKEQKYKRNKNKAKTVLDKQNNIQYLLDLDNYPINKYISVAFTNRFLNKVKSQKNYNKRNNLIHIILEEDNNKNKNNKNRIFTDSNNSKNIKKKKRDSNMNNFDYFSLNEFLTPYITKGGEEYYLTKTGNVLINKKQKDILEDYINNNLFDDDEDNKNKTNRSKVNRVKEKVKRFKEKKNKRYSLKGTNIYYDLDDITQLFQKLPASFQVPIDDFYLRRKKASLFDRSIFKICHKVIDNYKELENKEDIFTCKSKTNKSKKRSKSSNHFEIKNKRVNF